MSESYIINMYADLVQAGKYTTDPAKVTATVKLVPDKYTVAVNAELQARGYTT